MNERQFNQRVILLVPAASPLQTTPVYTTAELRAKRDVLAMAEQQREGCNRVIDRLRAELGMPPEER
jgi:hypothetical protein